MKIVVIGGSGLIGKKVVMSLRQHGHEVAAARLTALPLVNGTCGHSPPYAEPGQ